MTSFRRDPHGRRRARRAESLIFTAELVDRAQRRSLIRQSLADAGFGTLHGVERLNKLRFAYIVTLPIVIPLKEIVVHPIAAHWSAVEGVSLVFIGLAAASKTTRQPLPCTLDGTPPSTRVGCWVHL